jgi:hypothetical protein
MEAAARRCPSRLRSDEEQAPALESPATPFDSFSSIPHANAGFAAIWALFQANFAQKDGMPRAYL